MMTIGPNNLLTLHPSIFSKDPDEINGQENVNIIVFYLICFRLFLSMYLFPIAFQNQYTFI
jgi:hypothetical protein